MIGREMYKRSKGCCQDQLASGLEQARKFVDGLGGVGHVLQHLAAHDGIGRWDGGDVFVVLLPKYFKTTHPYASSFPKPKCIARSAHASLTVQLEWYSSEPTSLAPNYETESAGYRFQKLSLSR